MSDRVAGLARDLARGAEPPRYGRSAREVRAEMLALSVPLPVLPEPLLRGAKVNDRLNWSRDLSPKGNALAVLAHCGGYSPDKRLAAIVGRFESILARAFDLAATARDGGERARGADCLRSILATLDKADARVLSAELGA